MTSSTRTAKTMGIAATANDMRDYVEVASESSVLVLTILCIHINMGTENGSRILSKDSINALIHGLQRFYDKAGHEGNRTGISFLVLRFRAPMSQL
jgi:hypothetical protein